MKHAPVVASVVRYCNRSRVVNTTRSFFLGHFYIPRLSAHMCLISLVYMLYIDFEFTVVPFT